MKIGQVADLVGLNTKTLRFYEEQGLLPRPPRTASGYRDYGPSGVERLEFIRKAKLLGLSLGEIKEVLALHDRQETTCGHVRSLLDHKLDQIDTVLRELQGFRRQLTELRQRAEAIEDCRPAGGRICGIIEDSTFGASQGTVTWVRASFAGTRGKE